MFIQFYDYLIRLLYENFSRRNFILINIICRVHKLTVKVLPSHSMTEISAHSEILKTDKKVTGGDKLSA